MGRAQVARFRRIAFGVDAMRTCRAGLAVTRAGVLPLVALRMVNWLGIAAGFRHPGFITQLYS